MGEVKEFRNITNWPELFDMTFELLTFLREAKDITPEIVIKSTCDVLVNAGYNYSEDQVKIEYYKCL